MANKINLLDKSVEYSTDLYNRTIRNYQSNLNNANRINFNESLFGELKKDDYIYLLKKDFSNIQVFKVDINELCGEIIVSNEECEIKITTMNYNINLFEGSFLIIENNLLL